MENNNVEVVPITEIPLDEKKDENQLACPKCGTVNLSLDEGTGHYTCNYCLHEFKPIKPLTEEELKKIKNTTPPQIDYSNMVAVKCNNCNTEVIFDKELLGNCRCPWCKHPLSQADIVQTRSVPSLVLPFSVTREEAKKSIDNFVNQKKILVLPEFMERIKIENIIPVYLPYVLVDIYSHGKFAGEGEHQVKKYYNVHESGTTYYDADTYTIEREFDLLIDGLEIEKDIKSDDIARTIIDGLKPFDIENACLWSPNYLKGCSSQNRNIDFNYLQSIIDNKAKLETKFAANETLEEYDRGVNWSTQEINIHSKQWKVIYLPVWLYSFPQTVNNKEKLNYIAVNGRTKEAVGNLPMHTVKLIGVSLVAELLGIFLMFFLSFIPLSIVFAFSGPVFFYVVKRMYQNVPKKEEEEKSKSHNILYNLRQFDKVLQRKTGLKTTNMVGANNTESLEVNTDVIYDERDNTSQSNKEFTKQK